MEESRTPISSEDLWIIFTSCPLEKGSPSVYHEYVLAKEREKSLKNKQIKNSSQNDFEM